jgi:hypothetical protein
MFSMFQKEVIHDLQRQFEILKLAALVPKKLV